MLAGVTRAKNISIVAEGVEESRQSQRLTGDNNTIGLLFLRGTQQVTIERLPYQLILI
jgi:hypothetical protein